jgi:hypothetical protein
MLKFGRQLVPPHALPHWIESRAPTIHFLIVSLAC